jgi:hypothetical protein
MVGVIVVAFAFQMFYAQPEGERILAGLFTPQFAGTDSVLLAAGILGATVMPHVIYLHSALTQRRVMGRTDEEKKKIFRFEQIDVVVAMAIAGTINASMLIMAAALFYQSGVTDVGDIDVAFEQLGSQVSGFSATLFGVALLASGFSSSSVGTMSGQVVMQGFINPGPGRARCRPKPESRAGHKPGGALLRYPLRADPAPNLLPQPQHHGGANQPPTDHRGGYGGRYADRLLERLSSLPDLLRLTVLPRRRL